MKLQILPAWCAVLAATPLAAQVPFSAPQKVTDSIVEYRLARNPQNAMALDSDGTLHLTYWKGSEAFSVSDPGLIYYRWFTRADGWSAEQLVNDPVVSHAGGRHSSLIVTAGDEVHLFWHDTRHGNPVLGWANNFEVYHDHIQPGGDFAASADERLTTTTAAHAGDNAYVPQPALDSTGAIVLTWYDFNANAGIADIYIKSSDASGVFTDESIASMRKTDYADRGGTGSFVLPALAIDSADNRYLAWIREDNGDLYYGHEAADGGFTATMIAAGVGDYFDPPRIAAAPNNDIWIANADEGSANEDIILRVRDHVSETFGAPINITNTPSTREYAPAIQVTADGLVHLAWVDERAGTHVYYAVYDPELGEVTSEQQVTDTSGTWMRPDLLVSDDGTVYLCWEEERNFSPGGDIWFAVASEPTAARHWMSYE